MFIIIYSEEKLKKCCIVKSESLFYHESFLYHAIYKMGQLQTAVRTTCLSKMYNERENLTLTMYVDERRKQASIFICHSVLTHNKAKMYTK